MTNQPKTTAATTTQKPAPKSQTLRIKLGEAKSWIPGTPCQVVID